MAKLTTDELIEAFKELTLIELSEFVKAFEETFDVKAAAPAAVAVAAAPGAAGEAAQEEEKDEFDVVLDSIGDKKIQVIKEVRALTSLGLKEAKAVVDSAPKAVLYFWRAGYRELPDGGTLGCDGFWGGSLGNPDGRDSAGVG